MRDPASPDTLTARLAALRASALPAAPSASASSSPSESAPTSPTHKEDDTAQLAERLARLRAPAGASASSSESSSGGARVPVGFKRVDELEGSAREDDEPLFAPRALTFTHLPASPFLLAALAKQPLDLPSPPSSPPLSRARRSIPALSPSLLDTLSGVEVQFFRPGLEDPTLSDSGAMGGARAGWGGDDGEEEELIRRAREEGEVERRQGVADKAEDDAATSGWEARLAGLSGAGADAPSGGGGGGGARAPLGPGAAPPREGVEEPFNCFSSSAHDSLPRHYTPHSAQRKLPLGTGTSSSTSIRTAPRHQPYSTAALPPLQASTRRRRSVHRLGSGGSGSSEGVDKARIGSPVGFKHLAHGGGGGREWAAGRSETHPHPAIDLLAPSPPSSTSRAPRPVRRKSLDASLILHLSSPSSSSSSPPPDANARHARQPSSSAPSSPTRAHPSPSSSPSPAPSPAAPRPRPRSALPPATTTTTRARKPAPQITPSVIRAAGGVERVRETGRVPSRLLTADVGPAPARREREGAEQEHEQAREEERAPAALEGWFTPSEIRAVGAGLALASSSSSEGGGAGQEQDEQDDERAPYGYDTDTARAFRGAMADVEAALRAEEDEGAAPSAGLGAGAGVVREEGDAQREGRAVGWAR
ncbi:hypothetical protein JCM9279_003973 [Rhodotorula babjevae]